MCINIVISDVISEETTTHSQWKAYMDLVENGGGEREEIEEPQGML